jgi:hypothetical protein
MTNNLNTWLAYFPYEKPTDSDPIGVISSSSEPLKQAQLFSHPNHPGNILMVPPGGTAYVYNAKKPEGALAFLVKNNSVPENTESETIVRPGRLSKSTAGQKTPFSFTPLTPEIEGDVVSLKENEEKESEIYFKNGLVRILHDILPNAFLEVPDGYIEDAITEPVAKLPTPIEL